MPNYVETSISFEGDENQVKELFEKVKVDELGLGTIDFSKVIPMPEDVVIECGSRTDKGLKAYNEFIKQYSNGKEVDLTSISSEKEDAFFKSRDDIDKEEWELGKQAFNNIQKYGVPTWYEWSINNWGTKWNSCGYVEGTDYSQCDKLQFQTAWSPALRVVQKLSQMYPDLKMTVQWADEDLGCNCGELTFKNGTIINDSSPTNSKDAFEFAAKVWNYDLEEMGLHLNLSGNQYIYTDGKRYELVSLFDKPVLITDERLTADDVPQGLNFYHLRGVNGEISTIEKEPVSVDFCGTIMTNETIDFGDEDYLDVDLIIYTGERITMDGYVTENYDFNFDKQSGGLEQCL